MAGGRPIYSSLFITNDSRLEGRSLSDICKKEGKGISEFTVRGRLKHNPKTPIELLLHPPKRKMARDNEKSHTVRDVTMTTSEWAISCGRKVGDMRERFRIMTPEEAVDIAKGRHRERQGSKTKKMSKLDNHTIKPFDADLELKQRIITYKLRELTLEEMQEEERKYS